jgi:hypothetical protein
MYSPEGEGGMSPWLKLAIALGVGGLGALILRSFGRKRIFISFDYDNDRHYRYLLDALEENSKNQIDYEDVTPDEIQSNDIATIKAGLLSKIKKSTHALVIVGAKANSFDVRATQIGQRNWQWWEIAASKAEGKGLIAVKIEPGYESPEPLKNAKATWAMAFKVDSILKAINET